MWGFCKKEIIGAILSVNTTCRIYRRWVLLLARGQTGRRQRQRQGPGEEDRSEGKLPMTRRTLLLPQINEGVEVEEATGYRRGGGNRHRVGGQRADGGRWAKAGLLCKAGHIPAHLYPHTCVCVSLCSLPFSLGSVRL